MTIYMATFLLLAVKCITSVNGLQETICETIYVKNYEDFVLLENCTVVIGNVIILPFIEVNYTKTDLDKRSFPLREITGFMILCAIEYAYSAGQFFPNLTVIRGQRLFANYALIIYESEFTELNLKSLLKISRGSMRIAGENQNLCMPVIDWESIIINGRIVMFGDNTTRSDCNSHNNTCHSCSKPGFCWNNETCQRFDQKYFVPGSKTIPCHHLCLGKCVDSTAKGCYVCRDKSERGECVQSCSALMYFNPDSRRCITETECIRQGRSIHNKDCVQNCPAGYMVKMNYTEMTPIDHYCKPCIEKCPRICSDIPVIRSIAQLEAIGIGCTIVNGSLEINIADDVSNLTAELMTYLGDIEEIHGNIKIYRSTPLTSLTFLNKLKLVYGMKNKPSAYSIRIYENQNLQSLFDWRLRDGMKLELKYGYIQIFKNVMLCQSEIDIFKTILIQNDTEHDFMVNNGYLRTCRNENIKTFSKVLSHDSVQIAWSDSFHSKNQSEQIVGYFLQYIEIEVYELKDFDENMLYERDTCSSHGWNNIKIKTEDFIIPKEHDFPNLTMSYILTNLTQYTYYAFTIQRDVNFTTDDSIKKYNSTISGTSEVNIFQTFMNIPKRVTKFSAIIKTHNLIILQWDLFEKEMNAINRLLLFVYEVPFDKTILDVRDYCINPINFDEFSVIDEKSDKRLNKITSEECCEKCCKNKKIRAETFATNENSFKESIIKFSQSVSRPDSEEHRGKMKNITGFKRLIKIDSDRRNYTVTDLNPFTIYAFHIYVCSDFCSDYEILYERTAMDMSFDQIKLDPTDYEHHSSEFKVRFYEPSNINGIITSYIIEISELIEKVSVPLKTECITRKQHELNRHEFSMKNMSEGNYLYRIKAISLAQHGPFTDWHHFEISLSDDKDMDNNKDKDKNKDSDDENDNDKVPTWMILLAVSPISILLAGIGVLYYCRHKIVTFLKPQNDTSHLLTEMEPTDFYRMSLNHTSLDRLSNITEYDDE